MPVVTKEEIIEKYKSIHSFGLYDLTLCGVYKLNGWKFHCPFLKKYIVKKYGNIREIFAPNKAAVRKQIG